MTWETYISFVVIDILMSLSPGATVLFVVSQSAWRGPKAGMAAALGVSVATLIFYALTAIGLIGIIAASNLLFSTMKYIAAAYLIWLGIQAIYQSTSKQKEIADIPTTKNAFIDGLIVEIANPKTLIFFLALLPPFLNPSAPLLPQLLILGTTTLIIEFFILAGYAYAAGTLREKIAQPNIQRWFNRMVGGVLISLGALTAFYRKTN